MKNRFHRYYLRFLYLGYLIFCFIFRPRVRGAYVLVTFENKILIIKNSYKPGWTFPCGMVDPGESEVAGAKRELFEETGIDVDESDLVFLKEFLSTKGFKKDHQFFYLLQLKNKPVIRLDMLEVIGHKWVTFEEMYQYPIPDGVQIISREFKDFIFK